MVRFASMLVACLALLFVSTRAEAHRFFRGRNNVVFVSPTFVSLLAFGISSAATFYAPAPAAVIQYSDPYSGATVTTPQTVIAAPVSQFFIFNGRWYRRW